MAAGVGEGLEVGGGPGDGERAGKAIRFGRVREGRVRESRSELGRGTRKGEMG